jgi:hypothetical protein
MKEMKHIEDVALSSHVGADQNVNRSELQVEFSEALEILNL